MFDDKLEQDLARKATDDDEAEGHAVEVRPVKPTDTDEPDAEPTEAEGHGFRQIKPTDTDEPDAEPSDGEDTEGHERA